MIREYKPTDIEHIENIWVQASALSQPFLSNAFNESERVKLSTVYIKRTDTWVYEEDGAIKGFIAMIDNEVGALFIHPDFHRQGIGSLLLDFVLMMYESLDVEVFRNNKMARKFYKKFGFKLIKEHFHEEANQELMRLRYTLE